MEVMMRPSENLDIDYYFSAPTSPSHLSQFYKEFDNYFTAESGGGRAVEAAVPFHWEEKPGIPKSLNIGDHDFAFDIVTQDMETASQLSAEELFDGGVIKPLKPPPPMISETSTSPISQTRKRIQGAFSPRHKNRGSDPSAAAARTTARAAPPPQRGRSVSLSGSSSRRAARSLSPLRDSRYPLEEEESSALSLASAKGQKKWSLKDFFLFRSASEGRAADKDPLKKYTAAAYRRSSFRTVESPGSGSGSSRRRGPVSAHELHYTVNRAVSEDLKKKTFLPYKQGILGRLAFNPAVHALANGFGFSRK